MGIREISVRKNSRSQAKSQISKFKIMLIDEIKNLKSYIALNPLFKDVVDFLEKNDISAFSTGKHEIHGNDLFVNIEQTKGKTLDEAVLEYHRKMIDIQIPLNVAETYGYSPVSQLPQVEFDEKNDIAKTPSAKCQTFVTVKPGQFVIFFPQDGHAPCIADGDIHKAIFKVKA